jgi:hypothetical protein
MRSMLTRPQLSFMAARISVVVTRPVILILLARLSDTQDAATFGKMLVATGIGMIVSAFDSGKHYYSAKAGPRAAGVDFVFHPYVARLLVPLVLGILVTTCLAVGWGGDPWTITATAVFLVTERIIDERQRYLLVSDRVQSWSVLQLWRGTIQLSCILLIAAFDSLWHSLTPAWFLMALCAGNVLVAHPSRTMNMSAMLAGRPVVAARLAIRSTRQLVTLWAGWASGLLASLIGFADRLIIAAWDDPATAGLLVATSALAIGPVIVSISYFTPRRGAIVRGEISVREISSGSFLLPWIGGLTIAFVAALTAISALPFEARPSIASIVTLAVVSGLSTIGGVLREIRFFGANSRHSAIIDFASILLLAIALVALHSIAAPVWMGLLAAAVIHAMRIIGFAHEPRQPSKLVAGEIARQRLTDGSSRVRNRRRPEHGKA